MVLEEELARQGRVTVQRNRGGVVETSVVEAPDGIGGVPAVPAQQPDRLLARGVRVLPGVPRVDVVDGRPGHAGDCLPLGDAQRELDLQGIHRRDVMDHHADRPPVAGQVHPPLRIAETGGQVGQIIGSLLEAVGEDIGTAAHGVLQSGVEAAVARLLGMAPGLHLTTARLSAETRHLVVSDQGDRSRHDRTQPLMSRVRSGRRSAFDPTGLLQRGRASWGERLARCSAWGS